jgi:hypothetical protein
MMLILEVRNKAVEVDKVVALCLAVQQTGVAHERAAIEEGEEEINDV